MPSEENDKLPGEAQGDEAMMTRACLDVSERIRRSPQFPVYVCYAHLDPHPMRSWWSIGGPIATQ